MRKSKKVSGFTLIELIIVLAIFGVIMFGALALLQPSRRMYTRSYSNESMISGAAQMSNYLEDTLRYASYVEVRDTAPDDEALKAFVTKCYDGKLKIKSEDDIEIAAGKLYVMHIDNEAGGKITKMAYDYTAGGAFEMDTDTKIKPVISGGTEDSSINEAIYNDFNYNISLGMYRTKATAAGSLYTLVRDDAFYVYNSNNFGRNNFGFTITAYPTMYPTGRELIEMRDTYGMKDKDGNAVTRIGDATTGHTFYNATHYASSVAFENMATESTYPVYKRDGATKKVIVEDGKPTFDTHKIDPDSKFTNAFGGTAAEPDDIYIIFTYSEDEINKA